MVGFFANTQKKKTRPSILYKMIDFLSFHTWIIPVLFTISLIFTIVAPTLPVYIPTRQFWHYLFLKYKKKIETPQTSTSKQPKWKKVFSIPLDMGTVPLSCVVILLCTGTLSFETAFFTGVIGRNFAVEAYSILILFMSMTYICTSLDVTGLFEFLANWMIHISRGRGLLLYI